MTTENQDLGPTTEELEEVQAQILKDQEAQERWWIDEHNGEHEYDPPMYGYNEEHDTCYDKEEATSIAMDELPF